MSSCVVVQMYITDRWGGVAPFLCETSPPLRFRSAARIIPRQSPSRRIQRRMMRRWMLSGTHTAPLDVLAACSSEHSKAKRLIQSSFLSRTAVVGTRNGFRRYGRSKAYNPAPPPLHPARRRMDLHPSPSSANYITDNVDAPALAIRGAQGAGRRW